MLLVASETGHVYTFATRKLQPMITSDAGKALIQVGLIVTRQNQKIWRKNAREEFELKGLILFEIALFSLGVKRFYYLIFYNSCRQ